MHDTAVGVARQTLVSLADVLQKLIQATAELLVLKVTFTSLPPVLCC